MINNSAERDDTWSNLLLAVARNQDEAAFARLFAHFGPQIKGFCMAQNNLRLPDEAAEELVQEVMLKVWLKAGSFDPTRAAASTWIFTMMRNCRIDMLRRQSRHYHADTVEADDLWDETTDFLPFAQLQSARDKTRIDTAFKELPAEQKQALAMVYVQGLSHSEIAGETGLPLGTVKSRVRMGLKKMKSLLGRKP